MQSISLFFKKYSGEYRALLRLGAPVLLTQVGVICVSFADTRMVGLYGVNELAAAAFVNSVFLIPLVMLMGLAAGLTPLVGALFGRGSLAEAGRIARGGLQINLMAGALFTMVMGALYFFLDCFNQPEEIMPLIRRYYLILMFTLVPMSLFNALQQWANGVTDTASPMWMILLSVGVNILLNWLLIYGKFGMPEMGLAGAGLATVIARVTGLLGMALIVFCTRRYHPFRTGFSNPGRLGAVRRKVWRTSYPVMIQSGVECSLWTFGAVVCGWYGAVQLASYQVTNTIGQLGFMIYQSFGVAVSVRVANYAGVLDEAGAGRCARAGVHINLLLATLASLVFLVGGKHLLSLFSESPDVISGAALLLWPLVLYQYLDALQLTLCNAIRGTSKVRPLLWISVVSYIIVGVPVLLLFADTFGWHNLGVYYSFDIALLTAAVMAWIVFRRTKIEGATDDIAESMKKIANFAVVKKTSYNKTIL